MCGIIAYLGNRHAYPILLEGLRRLEYRGYDSAGVALINGEMLTFKKKGKVNELAEMVASHDTNATIGIGHTRWATHGEPNDINAHPQLSSSGRIAVVHNGIIENHSVLKRALQKHGHAFVSDTDTEVLSHLIEVYQQRDSLSLEDAVLKAMNRIVGAYAIVVIDRDNPDKIVAMTLASSRKGPTICRSLASKLTVFLPRVLMLHSMQHYPLRGNRSGSGSGRWKTHHEGSVRGRPPGSRPA